MTRASASCCTEQHRLQQPEKLRELPDITCTLCRKPTLQIQCGEVGSAALTLRLLPTCDPDMLQLRKLSPDANAVRTICGQPATAQAEQTGLSTPHYNTSILQVSQSCRTHNTVNKLLVC
jgi:Nrap protein domain 1